jgi:hypothetical protein
MSNCSVWITLVANNFFASFLPPPVALKMAVFWVVVPCILVEVYHYFRCACCLCHREWWLTLVNFYHTTWHYNTEGCHLHTHCQENLKSYFSCFLVFSPWKMWVVASKSIKKKNAVANETSSTLFIICVCVCVRD